AAPAPMRSPTTTSPVAIPTRTFKGEPAFVASFGTASTRLSPARTARSASCSCARGVAEIGENAITHIFRHEATIALNQFGAAAVIGSNDAPQVLGVEPAR